MARSRTYALFFLIALLFFLPLSRYLWDPGSQYLLLGAAAALQILLWIPALAGGEAPHLCRDDRCLALFLILLAASAAFSENRGLSLARTAGLAAVPLAVWPVRNLNGEQKNLLETAAALSASLFSLLYLLTGILGSATGAGKTLEFFVNPNVVAAAALAGIFLPLQLQARWPRFAAILALLNAAALVRTESLAALFALAAGFAFLLRRKEGAPNSALFKIVPAVTAAGALLYFLFLGKGWSLNSVRDRLHWWSQTLAVVRAHPLLGCGPGVLETILSAAPASSLRTIYAHNFPLQTAAECGIAAAGTLLFYFLRRFRRGGRDILRGGALALFLQSLVDFPLHLPGILFLFWLQLELSIETVTERPARP